MERYQGGSAEFNRRRVGLMSGYKINIGKAEVLCLSDGRVESPTGEFFPSVPPEDWEPYRDQLTPDGKLAFNLGSFLVRSGGTTVLVDTGLGPNKQESRDVVVGLLLDDLSANGVGLEDIDVVVMTHVHRDHVGWNVVWDGDSYQPTFPRARYWVPRADWEALVDKEAARIFPHVREQVLALEGLGILELLEGERSLTDELATMPSPGHTPGHTSLVINSEGESGFILGDVAHHPVQVHETEWSPFVDVDPSGARATRRGLMERLEREGPVVAVPHFPAPGLGRMVRLHGRRLWRALETRFVP